MRVLVICRIVANRTRFIIGDANRDVMVAKLYTAMVEV